VDGQAKLLQVVAALRAAGGFAGCLHGGQEQGDQDCNDRDDDQEFNQRESATDLRMAHDAPLLPWGEFAPQKVESRIALMK
jgi:hypothetical protein